VSAGELPAGAARALVVVLTVVIVFSTGCAARRLELPSGTGAPFPAFDAAFEEATAGCRAIDTMTAEVAVSGRVGGQKLRGRVLTGFARPARLRLEGLAPFGPPAFILVSSGGEGTLLLPRDPAVLRGEPPEAIIEALVGLPLEPPVLHSVLAGCGLSQASPVAGAAFDDGWARVDGAGGAVTYLRQDRQGRWTVQASLEDMLRVEYEDRDAGPPRAIRLELEDGNPRTELRLQVGDVDVNVALGDEAFLVKVPADATPITLEELRRAGPLGPR
jgi:outer membrane lipoprotein-sorting protein